MLSIAKSFFRAPYLCPSLHFFSTLFPLLYMSFYGRKLLTKEQGEEWKLELKDRREKWTVKNRVSVPSIYYIRKDLLLLNFPGSLHQSCYV